MKKIFALLLALAMVTALVACGSSSNSGTTPADNNISASDTNDTNTDGNDAGTDDADSGESPSDLSGNVATGGSTSMQELMEIFQETFRELYPNVNVTYEPTGSSAGITGVQEQTLDIGLSSRNLHDDEEGLTSLTVALDGIDIIVNTANPVEDLSLEQIASIATGEITNWSELGGDDAEIVVIGREASSGTRDGFESIVGVADECVYAQELTSTGAVIAAVQSNQYAIGYASMAAVTEEVKAVTVNGVACSEETVQDGTYAIQRPFNFILNEEAELSEAAGAFLEFTQSEEAAELIALAGAVPVQ